VAEGEGMSFDLDLVGRCGEKSEMSTEPAGSSLEQRIVLALADDINSGDLAALVAETDAAIARATATADEECVKALDPALSPDATAAREAMQAAEFARDRLKTVLPRLKERHRQIAAQEYLTEWRADYETLKVARDELAAELRETYPEFETKITDLFARIAANDEDLGRLHQARPAGVSEHLCGAELEARGLDDFTISAPSVLKTLRLPTFEPGERVAWPPPQSFVPPPMLVLSGDQRLFSGDWWQVYEEQQAAAERSAREDASA
jgi:hypothetical protein